MKARRGVRAGNGSARIRRATADAYPWLFQVHPVPEAASGVLLITMHFVRQSAAARGKLAPALSEDAAVFLLRRTWSVAELAARIDAAVAFNQGSLITAADLCIENDGAPA